MKDGSWVSRAARPILDRNRTYISPITRSTGGVLMQKHSATMDTKSKDTEYYGSGRMVLESDIVAAPISSL